jgi:hypothetical protein
MHRPIRDALERAAFWFVEKGYAKPYPSLVHQPTSEAR